MTALHDLSALFDHAARITAAATPEARAATCRDKQRQAIADAAYTGDGEQQAAMRVAQKCGDTYAIAQCKEWAQARVAVALMAYDRVFGGEGSADAVGPSGGAGLEVNE